VRIKRIGRAPGLPKTGGRQKGTPNKRSIGLRAGLGEVVKDLIEQSLVNNGSLLRDDGVSLEDAMKRPLQFLLAVVADVTQPIGTRIAAATATLPYTNHRLGPIDTSGRDVPLMVQVVRFSDGELISAPKALDMSRLVEDDTENGRSH
jgi:hypothetical protein